MSLRYYVYISDSKVDMLLPQVDPGFGDRRSSEVGVDLKLLKGKRKVESSADRIGRLERVVRHLDDFCDVGTIDEPGQYFRGRMAMRWGQLKPGLIYFGGATDETVVGLSGAGGHVVGGKAPSGEDVVFAPSSLAGLTEGLDNEEEAPESALALAYRANRVLRGDEQEVEFVAKRLRHGPSPYPEMDAKRGMTVLLGSPIFVALAE